jgi:hypothetical protein
VLHNTAAQPRHNTMWYCGVTHAVSCGTGTTVLRTPWVALFVCLCVTAPASNRSFLILPHTDPEHTIEQVMGPGVALDTHVSVHSAVLSLRRTGTLIARR